MVNHKSIPTVCIVGRPNVGKSSLFNVLLGERKSVVYEESGTTRDISEGIISYGDSKIKLMDTGGYVAGDQDELSRQVKLQVMRGMHEGNLLLFVTDSISGIMPADKEIAAILRKFNKPIIVVANKTDNEKLECDAMEFYQLGFGEAESVSCLHRRGIRNLRRVIFDSFGKEQTSAEFQEEKTDILKIAVIGRPNVGKSSFINNLLKRERVIVSVVPGTTRDSIDTRFTCQEDEYLLIDTAGMRHTRKIKKAVDVYSIMRSKESIKRADAVILLLDAADGATKDDIGIIDFIEENGKACLIAVNKWDLAGDVEGVSQEEYIDSLVDSFSVLKKFPITFISAKTGKNVLSSLSMIKVLDKNLDLKVSTPFLNNIFKKNDPSKISISRKRKRPNFLYIVQSGQRPVEFKFFVNDPSSVLPAHLSYIENKLRARLPLSGIPIKILTRKSRKERK